MEKYRVLALWLGRTPESEPPDKRQTIPVSVREGQSGAIGII